MNTAIISKVDRKRRLSRLLKEGRTVWIADTAAFSQRRGRRALVLPPEEEAEGNGRRSHIKKRCPTCGTTFITTDPEQIYCSTLCREEAGEVEETPAEAGGDGREFAKILSLEGRKCQCPTTERREADQFAEVGAGELEGAAKVSRKVEDEAEVRRLLAEVANGTLPVKAEPFTLPQEREFHLWVSADNPKQLEVDCNIPKYVRRLAILYARGEFVPAAIDVWPYEGGPFVTAVEGHAPAKLLNLRGWTGRGRKAKAKEAVSMTNEEEGGEDA
jgi:hypothetical protein